MLRPGTTTTVCTETCWCCVASAVLTSTRTISPVGSDSNVTAALKQSVMSQQALPSAARYGAIHWRCGTCALHPTTHHMAVRHSNTMSLAMPHGRGHPRVLSCIMHCPVVGNLSRVLCTRVLSRQRYNGHDTTTKRVLFMAFALSEKSWELGFTVGHDQKPRERSLPARNQTRLLQEVARAKKRCGLSETTPVVSCYAAGREGFWQHRFLQAQGITNAVVDSSAIEINRRQRSGQERCIGRAQVKV